MSAEGAVWQSGAGKPLRGTIRVPGDKSISHRAMMLGALSDGICHVSGFLEGEDTLATAAAFRAMGVRIEDDGPGRKIVHGVGIDGLRAPAASIDCGNAGTGMRLLAGLLAGQRFDSVLVGDASLSRRPMRRVTEPLARMGARIDTGEGGLPPLRIHGGQALIGIDYPLPVASAQVKSALLLAGLYAQGETVVREPHPTRDYTERMLAALGWPIEFSPGFARMRGGHRLRAADIAVPSDFSSAAFFLVAASIVPGSDLLLEGVGMNPRRTGLLHALRLMGANITERNVREEGGELGDPCFGQFTLAFGKPEDGALFGQRHGEGRTSWFCLGHLRPGEWLFAVDHQRAGGQVAEAFEVGMLQATDRAEKVAEGQHVDKPQQVADQ